MPEHRPLTGNRLQFVEAYIACKENGTRAAMEACDGANRTGAFAVKISSSGQFFGGSRQPALIQFQ